MPLEIDMVNVIKGNFEADNFHAQLIRLFLKADRCNFARLGKAFPNTAKLIHHWQRTGEILKGIPYE